MPGAAIGALLGFALSGTGLGIGIAGFLGISAGTLWMVGASLGSLFDGPDIDLGGSTPNYSFGQLSNTKSQLLPIPIVYGRCRVGGNIFMQKFYDDTLQKMDMLVGVSEGPIQSIKSIYASDTELTDVNGDITHELEEVTLNVHLGEPGQVADSRDPSGSTYANVAYVGLTLKAQDGLSGNPVISSIVEGRKIWTPAGTVFTRNPAWIVYDFLTNTRYGVGVPQDLIDLDSFMASADYCDALVEGEPRFTLDYIIDTQRPAVDHLQSMLACFRGYFLARDKIELHVEQAGSIYKALGPDNFVKDSFSWWQKSGDDSPNRITLEWIDPDNHYEQSSAVFEHQEDMQARGVFEKSFSVLGVTRSSQVGRLGNYLMETAKRVQNFCSFQVGLQDADIEAGEIISLTYPDFTGWDEKPFRVVAVQDHGDSGVVTVTCAEYDATVYGDDALPVQTPIVDPTPVTYDDVYSLALEDTGHIADDGTWFPVIRATWQNPSDYTPAALNIRWRYSGDTVWNLHLNTSRMTTQTNITGLTTGEDLEVWVNCVKPNNGGETTGVTATLSVGRDVIPPVAPTSLTATSWFGSIYLEWLNPADRDLSHIEVWENAIDNRATAVKIAETKGTSYQRYVGSFITRYYWVRAVDFSGNIGSWNALAGTAGNSDQENHQDFVDLLLEENPYLNEAIGDLNTRIDPIETNLDNFLDVTLPEIVNVTLPGLTDRLETVEVDLPGAVQRLAERMKEIDADVMDQLRSVSSSAVDALLNIAEIGQRITDAGIVVDPDSGEVRIWAVDQLRTEHGVRLSNAEQLISAQAGIISQKVGIADVDARIAEAVFGDVGELLVSGLEAHITSVEQELNAAKAELTQKATVVEVDAIGGRVGTAETKISGLEASVALKATQEEVDELTSRVTTAEFTVDALNGTIGSEIVAIGQEGRDLANLTADGLVEAILNDFDNHERAKIQLATAKTEIYARVEEGLSAEAGQRTALAATVAGNTAAIIEESSARSTEDGVIVGLVSALEATVEGNDTAVRGLIATESEARADEDEALADQITTLAATVGGNTAAIQDEASVRSDADTALARFSRNMQAVAEPVAEGLVEDVLNQADARKNAVQQYAMIRQDYDVKIEAGLLSEATAREALATRVGANESAILSEAVSRSTADDAMSKTIDAVSAKTDKNEADIQTETEARTNAVESVAGQVTTLAASTLNGTVTESTTPPGSPTKGQVYYNTTSGKYFWWDGAAWQEVKGVLGKNTAAIQTETTARTTADTSLANQITTLETTTVGGDVTESATAPANPTKGQSYYNTTSKKYFRWNGTAWVEIKGIEGHSRSAIQIINESVDGIKGKHAVKIDTNGYVTGYELIGTGTTSSMVFHVENFLIGKPGTTSDYPFAIGTVDGVTRISMKNVFIQDASIETLKIANNAVTTYVFVTGGQTSSWRAYYGTGTPTWRDLPANNSVTVTEVVSGRPAMITFSVNWFSAEDYSGTSFRVLANTTPSISGATVIWSKNVGGGDVINMSYTEQFQWNPSSSGTWYLYIQWRLGSGGDYDSKWNTYIRSHSLSLFHMKR